MKMQLKILALLCGWTIVVHQASGSILAEYDFTGAAGDQISTNASWSAAGVTASVFRRGFGIEAVAGLDSMTARAWTAGEFETELDYFEFTITPLNGANLDINEIAFGERRNASGIREFTLRSSLDGYASNIITPVGVPDDGNTRAHKLAIGASFDAIASSITFRLYGYFSETSTGRWGIVNHPELGVFRVSGTSSQSNSDPIYEMHIPEPAALAVWGLVAAFATIGSYFRRQQLVRAVD
jgi:hypothetical protein